MWFMSDVCLMRIIPFIHQIVDNNKCKVQTDRRNFPLVRYLKIIVGNRNKSWEKFECLPKKEWFSPSIIEIFYAIYLTLCVIVVIIFIIFFWEKERYWRIARDYNVSCVSWEWLKCESHTLPRFIECHHKSLVEEWWKFLFIRLTLKEISMFSWELLNFLSVYELLISHIYFSDIQTKKGVDTKIVDFIASTHHLYLL